MSKISKSFTLTRWHKIVERLNGAIGELSQTAKKRLAENSFDVKTRSIYTEEKVSKMAKEGLEALTKAQELLKDVTLIRQNLAEENVRSGVSSRLSEIDTLQREASLIRSMVTGVEDKLSLKDFLTLDPQDFNQNNASSLIRGNASAFGVTVISEHETETLKQRLASIKKRISNLSDEVADANRGKISIDLSKEAIEAADLE